MNRTFKIDASRIEIYLTPENQIKLRVPIQVIEDHPSQIRVIVQNQQLLKNKQQEWKHKFQSNVQKVVVQKENYPLSNTNHPNQKIQTSQLQSRSQETSSHIFSQKESFNNTQNNLVGANGISQQNSNLFNQVPQQTMTQSFHSNSFSNNYAPYSQNEIQRLNSQNSNYESPGIQQSHNQNSYRQFQNHLVDNPFAFNNNQGNSMQNMGPNSKNEQNFSLTQNDAANNLWMAPTNPNPVSLFGDSGSGNRPIASSQHQKKKKKEERVF